MSSFQPQPINIGTLYRGS